MHKNIISGGASLLGAAALVLLFIIYYVALDMRTGVSVSPSMFVVEQGKILWGTASIVLDIAMLWCIAISFVAANKFSLGRKEMAIWRACGVLVFILIGGLIVYRSVAGDIGQDLLQAVFDKVPSVRWILMVNNITVVLLAISFAFASVLVTREVEQAEETSLAERINWFKLAVYSGGVVLAIGLYQVYRLYQWGALLIQGAPTMANQSFSSEQSIAAGIAVGGGLLFSALMVLIFIPSAIQLDRRLKVLMSQAVRQAVSVGREFDRQRWEIENDLGSSPLHSVGGYVALLLPVLTGLIAKIIKL